MITPRAQLPSIFMFPILKISLSEPTSTSNYASDASKLRTRS